MTSRIVASEVRATAADPARESPGFVRFVMIAGLASTAWSAKSVLVHSGRVGLRLIGPESLNAAIATSVVGLFLVAAALLLSVRTSGAAARLVVLLALAHGTAWAAGPLVALPHAANDLSEAARFFAALLGSGLLAHLIVIDRGAGVRGAFEGRRRFLSLLYAPALAAACLIVLEIALPRSGGWGGSLSRVLPLLAWPSVAILLAAFAFYLVRFARVMRSGRERQWLASAVIAVTIVIAVALDAIPTLFLGSDAGAWRDAIWSGRGAAPVLLTLVLVWCVPRADARA